MKQILLFILFISVNPLYARQVAVAPTSDSAGITSGQYSLDHAQVQINGDQVLLDREGSPLQVSMVQSASVAPNGGLLGLLHGSSDLEWTIYDSRGEEIRSGVLDFFAPSDETLQIHQFDDGRAIVRDNVANFSFFNTGGTLEYRVSNSSQSEYGETLSQLTADRFGRTVVLFNPRINRGGGEVGSRARLVQSQTEITTLIESPDRWIGNVSVSQSGSFITIISKDDSGADLALLFDRFGNELARFSSDEDLIGASVNTDASFITLYSATRTQVFAVENGESAGSASFQAFVVHAAFQPEDNQIVALTGSIENSRLTDGSVYVVDLTARQIRNAAIESPLSILESSDIQISRLAEHRFLVSGFNRDLVVTTSF